MEHFYNIYGIRFRIRTNDRLISSRLRRALGFFKVSKIKNRTDVKLDFIYLRNKVFKFRLPKDAQLLGSFILNLNGQKVKGSTYYKDNRIFLIQEKLMYSHWDKQGGSCFIFSNSYINSRWLHYLINTSILDILSRKGYFPIHAAGTVINKKGVLFAGGSGSGKSTTIAYLIKKGFGFLGDDTVILRNKSKVWIYPFSPYISSDNSNFFSYFFKNKNIGQIKKITYYWFKEKGKFFLNIKKFNPNLFIEKAPLALIFFPILSKRDECKVKRISIQEASCRLLRQVTSIGEDKEKILLVNFLAKNVNCYKLYLGKNLKGLETKIKTLI